MLKWLYDRNNITLIIAIAGFVLSLASLFYQLIRDAFKIRIDLKCFVEVPNCIEREFLFVMNIENLSRQPVSISRIVLSLGNKSFDFESVPHPAYNWTRKVGEKLVDEIKTRTIPVPQTIGAYGTIGDFFYVIIDKSIQGELLDCPVAYLEVKTTRGKKKYSLNKLSESPNYEKHG